MYVEFVGISGSGKTSLAESLKESLRASGISCVTREVFFKTKKSKLFKLMWTVFRLPYLNGLSIKMLFILYANRKIGFKRVVRALHEHMKLCYSLSVYSNSSSVILWDGGFVQRFANLSAMGLVSAGAVADFIFKQLLQSTMLVFIDVPIDIAIQRRFQREVYLRSLSNRQMSYKSSDQKQREVEYLTQARQAQHDIVAMLDKKGVSVFTVDGTLPVEENVAILHQVMQAKLL
ncbi:MAG: hypothetical protein WDZ85_01190 [Candidatus Paceibacterota bacterium]